MPVSKKPRKKTSLKSRTGTTRPKGRLPDQRALERYMAGRRDWERENDLDKAQDLIYRAWESEKHAIRVRLAKRALSISPLCADAYALLAEESARSIEKRRELYELGVQAGGLALGPEVFEEDVGYFWGLIETRPYMRARCGLAEVLWTMGERDEAIGHYNELLRLNPNDNQGVRYLLCACLLETGDAAALETLLEAYVGDSSAFWTYTRALCAYRAFGATDHRAVERLAEALEANEHVPAILSGEKSPPAITSPFVSMGGEDEAAEYVGDCGEAWKQTPGAIEWLTHAGAARPPRQSDSSAPFPHTIYRPKQA